MADWPLIPEPELLRRLAMDDAEFRGFVAELLAALPARQLEEEELARAFGYPWERPSTSFLLGEGGATALEQLEARDRERAVRELLAPAGGRLPVLAIGSNASPEVLARKLGHLSAEAERTVLAVSGHLSGFDVGVAAQPAIYGSLPATLFPSPGTAVSAVALSLTPAQLTQLAWTELNYSFGRLRTRFDADLEGVAFDEVYAFVSRFGTFCLEGRPVALAAVPAERRRAPALSQEQALDAAAALALGPQARAELLVRAVFEDAQGTAARIAETIHAQAAQPFDSDRWTPYSP